MVGKVTRGQGVPWFHAKLGDGKAKRNGKDEEDKVQAR